MQSSSCIWYKNKHAHPLKEHEFNLCRRKKTKRSLNVKPGGFHPLSVFIYYLQTTLFSFSRHSAPTPVASDTPWCMSLIQLFHLLGTLTLQIPRWLRQGSVVWPMPTYSEGFNQPQSAPTTPNSHPLILDSSFFSPRPASPSLQHLFVMTNASYNYQHEIENLALVPIAIL